MRTASRASKYGEQPKQRFLVELTGHPPITLSSFFAALFSARAFSPRLVERFGDRPQHVVDRSLPLAPSHLGILEELVAEAYAGGVRISRDVITRFGTM